MASMIAQFQGHTSIITWCAFNDRDTRLYTASFDGTLREWNTNTAQCLRVFRGHIDSVLDGDVSSSFDSVRTLLVGASMDKTARIWDLQSPTSAFARDTSVFVLRGHQAAVKSVTFVRPSCKQVITGGLDRKLMVWTLPIENLESITTLKSQPSSNEDREGKSMKATSKQRTSRQLQPTLSSQTNRNRQRKPLMVLSLQPIFSTFHF
jgi:WD40 repeat protein